MKVIVTGSRDWEDDRLVRMALDQALLYAVKFEEHFVLVHGACPTGADKFADLWAADRHDQGYSVACLRYPADWFIGRKAGPLRNQKMVDENIDADMVLAFPRGDSRGTRGCMAYAESKWIQVKNLGDE